MQVRDETLLQIKNKKNPNFQNRESDVKVFEKVIGSLWMWHHIKPLSPRAKHPGIQVIPVIQLHQTSASINKKIQLKFPVQYFNINEKQPL